MTEHQKKLLAGTAGLLLAVAVGVIAWQQFGNTGKDSGLVSGNGRIEAVEIDVAAKSSGRVKEIFVREGELVTAGQVVAAMDTETLQAELRQADAQLQQAQSSVATARSQLAQRVSEHAAVLALIKQREAELVNARQHSAISSSLVKEGAIAKQDADDDYAKLQSAEATVNSARAQAGAAEATIWTVRSQIAGAQASVNAAIANIERIKADIRDSALKSPRDGRVQYKVAQLGEVVGAGGRGAGFAVVWPQLLSLALIGVILFSLSLARFRKTIGTMV